MSFERGSEWRKWDLHFHTPASFDYQDKSLTPEAIVEYLVKKEVDFLRVHDVEGHVQLIKDQVR